MQYNSPFITMTGLISLKILLYSYGFDIKFKI